MGSFRVLTLSGSGRNANSIAQFAIAGALDHRDVLYLDRLRQNGNARNTAALALFVLPAWSVGRFRRAFPTLISPYGLALSGRGPAVP